MIHNSAATELCITKGQEAFVYRWDCQKGPSGKDVLNTLFVKLANPPCPIKLDGLPLNVLPPTRMAVTTSCKLPNNSSIAVTRCQIKALPNFAMTDYASQGKMCLYNVVDLSQSCSHQSYYTSVKKCNCRWDPYSELHTSQKDHRWCIRCIVTGVLQA